MRRLQAVLLLCVAGLMPAACNSTQDVLEPSAITPPGAAAGATPLPTPNPSTAAAAAAPAATPPAAGTIKTAAVTARPRIEIAPIVGTSVEAATALSQRLISRAREKGITLTAANDPSTTQVMKGYFTPLTEGRQTTVIYVWDVYDTQGNRIHRISGQQKAPSAEGEGWKAVSDATMHSIGEATMDQVAAWLAGGTG